MNNIETVGIQDPIQIPQIKIYSKKAIWGFSFVFAPIFAGVLLRQNLLDTGRRKDGNIILAISIGFTLATIFIVNTVSPGKSSLTYFLNLSFGAILSEYFFKKYFPENNYTYKKIWKPLIISILILIPFVLAMIFFPGEG